MPHASSIVKTPIWNALIRTHHITSRAKVNKVRTAAGKHEVHALLCSGGCPGIMYCEGAQQGVQNWVKTVQRLRYKDFQLVVKPEEIPIPTAEEILKGTKQNGKTFDESLGILEEVESVKEFGSRMQELGIWDWWRKGMGYVRDD